MHEDLKLRNENVFKWHEPKPGQAERYVKIRDTAKAFADMLVDEVPFSRELSAALTRLEEAVMFANAGIARNE